MTTVKPALLAPVIAHRGASGIAPENTLAALELAAEQGAECIEMDVSISADGVPFVHHDFTLRRCTNGRGYLCSHTAAHLDTLIADKLFAKKGIHDFSRETLPRLSAALSTVAAHGMGLNIEIKPTPGLEIPTAEAVCQTVKTHWQGSPELPLVISSFSKDVLYVARKLLPNVPRALLVCAIPQDWQAQVKALGCRNIHCAAELADAQTLEAMRQYGLGIYCFTVNSVRTAKHLFTIGAHGVISNYPGQMLAEL